MSPAPSQDPAPTSEPVTPGAPLRDYTLSLLVLLLVVAGCLALRSRLNPTDVAMVLLLADVFVASRYSRNAALVAALLSILAFDFLFVPPYYTFNVHDTAYFLTFGVMVVVAFLMSRLTSRVRQDAQSADERERRTAALYDLSRALGSAAGVQAVLRVASAHFVRATGSEPTVLLATPTGSIEPMPTSGVLKNLETRVAAGWAFETKTIAGKGTAHCAEAEALILPLSTPSRILGVVIVPLRSPDTAYSPEVMTTLQALAGESARALERTVLAESNEQARMDIEAEKLRTALLSSLSHDLRSPLGSIEGAASLLHREERLGWDVRQELAGTILHESQRMTRLVANLLDMIRVESGSLAVRKEWQLLEEVLGVALIRLEEQLKSHHVRVSMPDDLPLVPIDELLIEQVFINLLENAAKYAPSGTVITVSAWAAADAVVVEVADEGPGIPSGDSEAVFHRFFRLARDERESGAGLGLTICRGIVIAHGGHIWVESTPAGGARFRFTLPFTGPPMGAVPVEATEA